MVQDMLYMYHLLESLKQKVELPMVLEMNNSIAVDIADSWSAGDRPQHVDVQNYLLCKLKDQGLLIIRQISGDVMIWIFLRRMFYQQCSSVTFHSI